MTLSNKRIVNTRAEHQAGSFDALIKERGAIPLAYPCIAIQPPSDTSQLETVIKQLHQGAFDWLVLTSANTVYSIAKLLQKHQLSLAPSLKIATVGSATAQEAETRLGVSVDLIPDEYIAEALAEALRPMHGQRICLPESAIARPTLAQKLREYGAELHVVKAYETVRGSRGIDLKHALDTNAIDAITFTSSSTVRYFVDRLHTINKTIDDLSDIALVYIGPKTAKTATDMGLSVAGVANPHTLDGLLDALENYYYGASLS